MAMEQGTDDLAALEEAFGLPEKFIDNLINEDDWSLIIKSHALLESACADMLCHYFGKYEIGDIFAHLDMSNKKYGKIAFISALKLLSKAERRFISELSELRNMLVHNVSNATFSLENYVSSLTTDKQKNLHSALNLRLKIVSYKNEVIEGVDLLIKRPKFLIWSSLTQCLSSIYIQDVFAIKRNELLSNALEKIKSAGPIHIKQEDIPLTIGSESFASLTRDGLKPAP
ncbi:hypothetical protein [Pseudomonas sp. 8O]|uniref:hypothetical protein n=1 Tax=Pseudomonas sp. 8O TaxID=2653165 RepID=UPI0012F26681|nr:hypothetical protein [Pseudomonas sp. 8O]VXC32329.1 conserved hypothetical protein [Pseudomonas sp. 8O]